jgi:hypothetical protein
MKPIMFIEQNAIIAKNQPQYIPLPAYRDSDGEVVTCWGLSFWERVKVLFRGRVWLLVKTFNRPIHPLFMTVDYPFEPYVSEENVATVATENKGGV